MMLMLHKKSLNLFRIKNVLTLSINNLFSPITAYPGAAKAKTIMPNEGIISNHIAK